MQRARAFVFAAEEDFGITLVEAQACGTPVIAFGRGGATDIVMEGTDAPTGTLFREQTPEAVADAVEEFEASADRITVEICRAHALRFSEPRFRSEITAFVSEALGQPALHG